MFHLVILAVALGQGGDIASYKKITYDREYETVQACTVDIGTAVGKAQEAFPKEKVVAVICEDLGKVQSAAALFLQKRIEKTEHTLKPD